MNALRDGPAVALLADASVHVGKLRPSELMHALAEVEQRFPVAAWRVAGVPVWPLLRARWSCTEFERHYSGLATSTGGDRPSSGAGRVVRRMIAGQRRLAAARRADTSGNDHGPAHRDLVFLSDGVSFARIGDRWTERFCDPLIDAAKGLGLSTVLWTPLAHCHQPRATPSVWLQGEIDRANLTGYGRGRLVPPPAHLPGLADLRSWLSGVGLDGEWFGLRRIVADGARLRAVANAYAQRLRATGPRLAFIVSYYSLEGMAFVLACREAKVPVVDLQHGVQGELHPCYGAWPRPAGGVQHDLLPDRFWVWSEREAAAIRRWSGETAHAPFVGGNPWLALWASDSTWPGIGQARAEAASLRRRAGGKPVALVTLQYGLTVDEQLAPLAALLRAASDKLAVWVRLHPAMLDRQDEVRAFLASAGPHELDDPTRLPLHAVLPEADVHLTHSSTAVIEAAQLGVPSVLTSPYGAELFMSLISSGDARLEAGAADVLLRSLLEWVRPRPAPGVSGPGDALPRLLAQLWAEATSEGQRR